MYDETEGDAQKRREREQASDRNENRDRAGRRSGTDGEPDGDAHGGERYPCGSSGGDGQYHSEDHLVCGNCGQQVIGVDALSESGRSLDEPNEQRETPHRDGDL
ncbi:hypothetical protein LPA44_13990 [Halobacterium sp. KA-4]|uniref:hypothetical protein n=1 Tax=Halobacterium sp. KA-4 TaxID=2896367 RepID=UPI001E56BC6E|nr:hypothetical protein [Halobacterium sp. KA-4]MCD2200997.1 hypothetical protein [Halobacterium sp. KA-4]